MIPNTKKKNNRNTRVFPSSGRDFITIVTNLFNLGILLTDLKGLMTLKALRPLIFDFPFPIFSTATSTKLMHTTKKSTIFQPLLR